MLTKNFNLNQKQIISLAAGILLILTLLSLSLWRISFPEAYNNLSGYKPDYPIKNYPLPIILYSNVSPNLIISNKTYFRQHGFSGFVISTLPSNWYSDISQLNQYQSDCLSLNRYFHNNYLSTSITQKDLPLWNDLEGWVSINQKIKVIASFAKNTGFKGLLLDTSDTDYLIWTPEYNSRYDAISEDFASKVIYQRARETIQTIESVFPQADVLITPLGIMEKPAPDGTQNKYYYWIHFVNGLLSTKHANGFAILTNTPNPLSPSTNLQEYVSSSNQTLTKALDEKAYWAKKGKICLLSSPVYIDKRANRIAMSAEDFTAQLFIRQKLSQEYIFVSLPAEDNFTEKFETYLKNINTFHDPLLKAYFQKLQTGKTPSILEYQLIKLYNIINKS